MDVLRACGTAGSRTAPLSLTGCQGNTISDQVNCYELGIVVSNYSIIAVAVRQ